MKPTARAQTILDLVRKHGWTAGAEVGVYEGATSDYLLRNASSLRMVGVDVWQPILGGDKDKDTGFSPKSADAIEAARRKAYSVASHHWPRFVIKQMDTVAAARRFASHTFDFVFIDASHMTEHVIADVTAWRPLVRPGGAVLGHDADWPSVQRALKALRIAPDYLPGNLWIQYV